MMKVNRLLEKMCILTFAITALTSVPLFLNYVKGSAPKFQLIVDLHVWIGLTFIILVSIRIFRNQRFVKSMLVGGKK